MSTPVGRIERASSQAKFSGDTRPLSPRHAPLPDEDQSTEAMSEVRPPPPADHTSSSGDIKIQLHQLGAGQTQQGFEFQQPQSVPDPALGGHLVG